MKKLQPFGDVPKQLTEQLRRSFVASRTFAQSLIEGKQILNKIMKVWNMDVWRKGIQMGEVSLYH
jgi:glypican 4 (K-glypican)